MLENYKIFDVMNDSRGYVCNLNILEIETEANNLKWKFLASTGFETVTSRDTNPVL